MTQKGITVVITTFKSESKIYKCLDSIDEKHKVIVIENSKNLSIKEKIEKRYTNVNCIIAGENLGYAKGNNLGLSKVTTPYALILNPDAILEENSINNFFHSAIKLKNFAIIAPAIQDEKNLDKNFNVFKEVNQVKGFAMFLNMEEFKEVGFFDENFFIYLEEIDLCKRLKNKNKKIFLDPNILINHQGGSSHDEIYNFEMELSRNWHWMWSNFYFLKKYNGYIIAFTLTLRKLFSSTIKYCYYSFLKKNTKKLVYKQRMLGLFSAMTNKPSSYRPFINN